MSKRIIASLESNICSASILARCVLPTPVGPRNKKLPTGLDGSLRPAPLRMIARTIRSTASSCPMILLLRASCRPARRAFAEADILPAGMPVMTETVLIMSVSVTLTVFFLELSVRQAVASSSSFCWFCSILIISAPVSKSLFLRYDLLVSRSSRSLPDMPRIFPSGILAETWADAPASSIISMALSGRQRSVMYRIESEIHAFRASGV